ncbi:MAG: hypothetical protein HC919_14915, partial [Oscillatoriales cyanobacterium SM2_2_1]|nr:hypothetical protein [Oscillatoriales cyanobacterium SM2_2_1]
MTQSQWDRIVEPTAKQAYRGLVRSLRWSKGFSISFVECSPVAGEELIARLQQDVTAKRIKVLRFDEPIEKLFHPLLEMPELKEVDVLIVVGLEKSLRSDIDPKGIRGEGGYYSLETAPPLLEHLNWQRDNFREYFPHLHFVFLLPIYGIKYFIRRAPDFFDWRSSVTKIPCGKGCFG